MNSRGARVVSVLVAGLLVAATACGGGDKKDDASSDNGGKVTATTEAATGSGSSGSGNSLDDLDAAMNALGENGKDCLSVGMAFLGLSLAPLGLMGGASQADIDKLKSDTEELRAQIPSAIQDDFDTYAKGIEAYANELKGVDLADIMDPATQQKMQDAGNKLETPEMKKAQENIEAYFNETCPSSGSDSSSSSSSSSS